LGDRWLKLGISGGSSLRARSSCLLCGLGLAGLAFPMIDINLCMEILELKDKFADFDVGLTNDEIEKRMEAHMDDIFNLFLDKEKVPRQRLPHTHAHYLTTTHVVDWRITESAARECDSREARGQGHV
jgi:hypothetical protein